MNFTRTVTDTTHILCHLTNLLIATKKERDLVHKICFWVWKLNEYHCAFYKFTTLNTFDSFTLRIPKLCLVSPVRYQFPVSKSKAKAEINIQNLQFYFNSS